MTDEKKLLRSDIIKECGASFYERGKHYYDSGMVIGCKVTSEGNLFTQLNATVDGSDVSPYKQNIRITWRSDYRSADIEGTCSCPIGYNCKHVVAACLMYQGGNLEQRSKSSSTKCLQWLDSLQQQPVQAINNDGLQEFIAYLLKPARATNELTVELVVTKEKKYGGFSKGRKTSLQNLRYSFSYYPYVKPEDSELAKILSALDNSLGGEPIFSGSIGAIALSRLLSTGRLYWEDTEAPALQLGTARPMQFDWHKTDQDDYKLQATILPAALPILIDPPHYLDTMEGTIGRIATVTSLDASQLRSILAAPSVPKSLPTNSVIG